MAKIVLDDTTSGYSASKINSNFQKIEDELNNKVLYRDNPTGEPNQLSSDLDMNGKRVYNLPAPQVMSEAARLQDVQDAISGATTASLTSFTPAGNIAANTVQGAIQELDTEKVSLVQLDASTGASLVGHGSLKLDAILKNQVSAVVASIGAIRSLDKTKYAQSAVVADGVTSFYRLDSADTTTVDNGYTVIVATDGGRWKLVSDGVRGFKAAGAKGDGTADDTNPIKTSVTTLTQRGKLTVEPATAYKITDTIQIFNKAGSVIDFGNQQINSSSFASARPALHFKTMSQSVIGNIFLIGSTATTNVGCLFDAAVDEITIHANVGKINVSSCDTGVVVGAPTYQMSDSVFEDIYASDCNVGIRFTGENTLAMLYNRVAAYNNTTIGVHLEQGGGQITSLQSAASGTDLYIGSTSGLNHNKLERWDILGGYSEEGVDLERFIDSAPCNDTNPFLEQITISNFRCTPFTSTNQTELVRWRLNGDLIFRNVAFNHGQQLPVITVDHKTDYRAPSVILEDCVIDCAPTSAPQLPLSYKLTHPSQIVEINARVNNGMTFWQNNGAANEGTIKRGIYMRKIPKFEQALLNIGNLKGAWNLRDITSGTCRNLVLGGASLATSATLERRDFWQDDGLIGFYRNSTTSKTISTTSADYAAAAEYTFGAILRPTSAGAGEENTTTLGGATGIRIALYDNAGGALLCLVGGVNAYAAVTNPYDPHLVIGRYVSGSSVRVNAINLRTGQVISATNTTTIPAFGSLTWSNGVSLRNDLCVRGFPFVYSRAITDAEVSQLQQAALQLTDSWRLA